MRKCSKEGLCNKIGLRPQNLSKIICKLQSHTKKLKNFRGILASQERFLSLKLVANSSTTLRTSQKSKLRTRKKRNVSLLPKDQRLKTIKASKQEEKSLRKELEE